MENLMSSNFDEAVKVILAFEGGWVNDPADLGRETNFGISMLFIEQEGLTAAELGVTDLTTPGCLKAMTVDTAKKVYHTVFWDRPGYDRIVNAKVATKLMDMSVNCGSGRGHRIIQQACNDLGAQLVVDGALGPKSIATINSLDPQKLVNAMCDRQLAYYEAIIVARPLNAKFRHNWTMRSQWGKI
jgi:type VI secretion system secreted protein VgrG